MSEGVTGSTGPSYQQQIQELRGKLDLAIETIKSIYKENGEVWLHEVLTKLGVPDADIDYWKDDADA